MSNKEDINTYCTYFKERLEEIKLVENRLYLKILLVAMIDSLARAVYPDKGNRERFISFIKSFSGWKDHYRVSLPQLSLNLQSSSETADCELEREIRERLKNWQSSKVHRVDEADPYEREIKEVATTSGLRKLVENSRHAELLYIYRNHLVHEFREPGHPFEVSSDDTSPYYFEVREVNFETRDRAYSNEELRELMRSSTRTWELVYPIGFFIRIAEKSLANLKHYLEDNDLNPYSSYQFGSIWRPNRS